MEEASVVIVNCYLLLLKIIIEVFAKYAIKICLWQWQHYRNIINKKILLLLAILHLNYWDQLLNFTNLHLSISKKPTPSTPSQSCGPQNCGSGVSTQPMTRQQHCHWGRGGGFSSCEFP